jgi:hypothetical protein
LDRQKQAVTELERKTAGASRPHKRKEKRMKKTNRTIAIGALALMVAMAANLAQAAKGNAGNPGVAPPQTDAHGQSYGAWSDEWWEWALSLPANSNPIADTTGQDGAFGQSGSVWFLAGVGFGVGPTVERSLTVPAGKALFFPLVNYVWINTPQYGDPEWSPEQEAYARALIATFINTAYGMTCQVDGRELNNLQAYRCQTPVGGAEMVTLPDNNVFGIPAGTYGPMVTDGYYLMLTPLTPGKHTIHFTAGLAGSTPMDVTYHLTVK